MTAVSTEDDEGGVYTPTQLPLIPAPTPSKH